MKFNPDLACADNEVLVELASRTLYRSLTDGHTLLGLMDSYQVLEFLQIIRQV